MKFEGDLMMGSPEQGGAENAPEASRIERDSGLRPAVADAAAVDDAVDTVAMDTVAMESIYRRTVEGLCTDAGQVGCPAIVFDEKKSMKLAAYHARSDELVLHPTFLSELDVASTQSYAFRGVVLHELGHRAAPGWIWARSALFFTLPGLWVLAWVQSQMFGFNAVSALMMVVGLLAPFAACVVSWVGEFRADDYACDTGGIRVAMPLFDSLDNVGATATGTHPPTSLRRARQLRRAGLPGARLNRDSMWRR